MEILTHRPTPRRHKTDIFYRASQERRRQRDREALEAIWRRMGAMTPCGLCTDGMSGPRCTTCVMRGTSR